MQYTIRNIPEDVDKALRKKAKAEGRSLNDAAVDALRSGLALPSAPKPVLHADLDWFLGTGGLEDSVVKAIRAHDAIDPDEQT